MVPTQQQLLRPLLEAVADGTIRTLAEVEGLVADSLEMDVLSREERLASGGTSLANRLGWVRTSLVKAGLIDQPGPSAIVITADGLRLLESTSGELTYKLLRDRFPGFARWLADMGQVNDDSVPAGNEATVWMLRAGRNGMYAAAFVENSYAVVGWGETGDVSAMPREALEKAVIRCFPESKGAGRGQAVNTLYRMVHTIADGDLVITPEPASRTLLLGRIDGPYQYLAAAPGPGYRHARPVRWFARVARDDLSYGARNSLGALLTLSRPSHAAELRQLADAHAGDAEPEPLVSPPATNPASAPLRRVPLPARTAVARRTSSAEFQTHSMAMLQLLDQLDGGQIALPDFQRSFVWAPDATRELIVSIIRAFPAGALLFLQGGDATFKARSVEAAAELSLRPSYLVLDGQQRLTSLYQALTGVGPSRFFLDVGSLLAGSEVNDAVRFFPVDQANELETRSAQADALMMPLSTVRTPGGTARWRDEVIALRDETERDRLRNLLYEVEDAFLTPLVQYRFPVTVLPESTELEAVCTIFETLNRTGKPLSPFELISARAFAGGLSLFDYWSTARAEHPILEDFDIEPYYLLQVIALQLRRSPKRASVLAMNAQEIEDQWFDAVADMAAAIALLRDECGVLVSKWLPYRPMLIPLATAWRQIAEAAGAERGAMRTKLRQWFWCECFSGEYESSSLSLAERDGAALRDWLTGGVAPPAVADFTWDPERWRTVTSRQQGLYRATMALGLTEGPRDFHSTAPLTREVIEAGKVDDHHVFPRGYLKDIGRGDEVDSVLNHTLIDRPTNIRIGKKAPSVYLADIRETLGSELDAVLMSHRLPTGPASALAADAFDDFLTWRLEQLRNALLARVGDFTVPAHAVNPQLTTLNAKIEAIELELRQLISARLENEPGRLPSHVSQKARERAAGAFKREPRANGGDAQLDLDTLLEFLDLRELEDILVSKASWPDFAESFRSKENLAKKFDQLAALRNGIRHSRTISEITLKEGEASLLWFGQVLEGASLEVALDSEL